MVILPNKTTKMWFQNNRSDILGTMWSSFNLNMTEQLGKTKISPRMVITTNGIANLGTPVAFKEAAGAHFTIAGSYAFSNASSTLSAPFTQLGSASDFSSDTGDLEIFNGFLYATSQTNLYEYTDSVAGTTSTVTNTLTSGIPHKLLNFFATNRLYVTKTFQQIISCDTSNTVASSGTNTLLIKNISLNITSMLQTSALIWILTFANYGSTGYVYTWDGVTADTPNEIIPLDSRGALAGIVKDGVPYIIDVEGKLMKYNGSVFILEPNGQLPIKLLKYLKNATSSSNNRWIHPNGITLVNNRINILVNNENNDNGKTIQEAIPSGIWEYIENGSESFWYHKNALTQYDNSGSKTVLDYGQNRISRVGALVNFKDLDSSTPLVGTIFAGADYFTDSSSTKSAVFTDDSLDLIKKAGYLVTNKILSSEVQDSWGQLYLRIRPLLNSTDKIQVKYRTTDTPATEATITWLTAYSFTTTTDLSSYSVGNEVEVLQGNGSGWCPNIKSLVNNGGTWTVTLDDNFPGSLSGTAKARFQTWKSGGTFTDQNKNLAPFSPSLSSTWIQFKVTFQWTGNNEMVDMILVNSKFQAGN